jgi:hypothetical protein
MPPRRVPRLVPSRQTFALLANLEEKPPEATGADGIEAQGRRGLAERPRGVAAFLHADANLMRDLIRRVNMMAN